MIDIENCNSGQAKQASWYNHGDPLPPVNLESCGWDGYTDEPAALALARNWLATHPPSSNDSDGFDYNVATFESVEAFGVSYAEALKLVDEPGGWNDQNPKPWASGNLAEQAAKAYERRHFLRAPINIEANYVSEFLDKPRKPGWYGATLYTLRDSATLPRRQWLYGTHLIRKYVSCTAAAPGVGKSVKAIADAIAMVSGKKLLHSEVYKPLRVWYFNLEDDEVEIDRRIAGTLRFYGLSVSNLEGGLYRDSGRVQPMLFAKAIRDGIKFNSPLIEALKYEIKKRSIDALIIDPFISSHQLPENDNGAIDAVVKMLARLADELNIAIELVHHTRKANGAQANVDSFRGGGSLIGATRANDVLNVMTADAAKKYGIDERDVWRYFRSEDAKGNLSPKAAQQWFKLESVDLGNGDFHNASDSVGVCTPYVAIEVADVELELSDKATARILEALSGEGAPFRADQQSANWAGGVVASVLSMGCGKADKPQLSNILKRLIDEGQIKEVMTLDRNRRQRKFIEVCSTATPFAPPE